MKTVLIITYHFPPKPSIGSVRLGGLAKYLPEFGWHPVILTPATPNREKGEFTLIETPLFENLFEKWKRRLGFDKDISSKLQIGTLADIENKKTKISNRIVEFCKGLLCFPDSAFIWKNDAYKYANKFILRNRVDILISSCFPVSINMIAHNIKKCHHIPWVADFRDLWTQNHYYPYGNIRKVVEKKIEIKTLKSSDAMITVSEPFAKKLKMFHKKDRIYSIPNGFDEYEHETMPLTELFTITYTGQLLDGKRDPRIFLSVLCELIKNRQMDTNKIRVRFYGPRSPWLETYVKKMRMDGIVSFGFLKRKEALKRQAESQLLLLLHWNDPEEAGVYTGKLFEYLGSRRPIISIGGVEGVVSELLKSTNAGIFCGCDRFLIMETLLKFYKEYCARQFIQYKGILKLVNKYSHREMTRKISIVLEDIYRINHIERSRLCDNIK